MTITVIKQKISKHILEIKEVMHLKENVKS